MKAFLVKLTIYAPYPIVSEHVIKASDHPAAAARAIRKAKQEITHKRRIADITLKIQKL